MIENNVSLKPYNTFGLKANAKFFYRIPEISFLESLWKTNLLAQSSPLILGGGSNMLLAADYPGLVIKNELHGKEIVKEDSVNVWLRIAGGENWHETVLWAVDNGWGGIENLSLIPGCVGAAPIQNIGAYGVELEQVLEQVYVFDLESGKNGQISHAECEFGYRDSIFKSKVKGRYFVSGILIKLSKVPVLNISYGDISGTLQNRGITNPSVKDVSDAVIQIRRSKLPDPAEIGNCGSFFKNPVLENSVFERIKLQNQEVKSFPASEGFQKISAAWLIENAGWKGFRRGDAGVHEKQALVIVNYGNASGAELFQLAKEVQTSVLHKYGVLLEMEVNVIG